MLLNLASAWKKVLSDEFEKPYFKKLNGFIEREYQATKCFPPESEIFAAFDYCSLDNLKVVIIGQDPYHGLGQANGLCFSVNDGVKFPPSLINIFKEIESDLDLPLPIWGNLQRWAEQGVLLLNATLTVRQNSAGSQK